MPAYADLELDLGSARSSDLTSKDTRATHRPYRHPRLIVVAKADDFLEALGPAQANCGNP